MPPSLIFLHQYFTPELAGSAQQLTDLAIGLRERGFSVHVVTGQPSYSSKRKLPRKENLKGVEIHRVPKIQTPRESAGGRIASAVSFFFAAFAKLLGMDSTALLVIGSDPPFLPLLGWLLRTIRGQKYVLIVSDVYPDVAIALGELDPNGWMVKVLEGINRRVFQKADQIVVLGEKMAERIQTKLPLGTDPGKIRIIHNWADEVKFRPVPKSKNRFLARHPLRDRLVVLFSGNLGKVHNFKDVLEASRSMDGNCYVEFLFIGDGPMRKPLEHQVNTQGLKNFRFLPYQAEEELPHSLACGDLALISLKEEVTGLCVPGKMYYALATGTPLLVIAREDSEPARMVRDYDCGWNVSPGDTEALVELLRMISNKPFLLEEKRKKARACFDAYFTRQRAIRQYESILS